MSTEPIRALTIRQPYAWAIASAGKTVENRSRVTRYRGLLAIHASKTVHRADLEDPRILNSVAAQDSKIDEVTSRCGVIVAVAELRGCHGPDCPGTCSPWAARGQYHWNLFGARRLSEPVPCRGMLGLWRLPADMEKAVREQLEAINA